MAKFELRPEKHDAELGRVYSINVSSLIGSLFVRKPKLLGFVFPDAGKSLVFRDLPKILREESERLIINEFGPLLELYEIEQYEDKKRIL